MSIVNGYWRHSQNSCSHLLPQGLNPNPQVNTCLQSMQQLPLGFHCPNWMWPCTCWFLPQLGLPVNSSGGVGWGWGARSLDGSLVDCWLLWLLARARLWSPVSYTMGRCVQCVSCSLCVALAVFVSWTRGVYPKRNDAAAATYVTVVRKLQGLVYDILPFGGRCRKAMLGVWRVVRFSQRNGWIETTPSWRNLSVVTEEGLTWLVIPQPPLRCRPCYCFWCCCRQVSGGGGGGCAAASAASAASLVAAAVTECRRGRRWCSVSPL